LVEKIIRVVFLIFLNFFFRKRCFFFSRLRSISLQKYLDEAQKIVMYENILLQTLGKLFVHFRTYCNGMICAYASMLVLASFTCIPG